MLFDPGHCRFRPVGREYPTVSRFDAGVLGSALFRGADRNLSPTEVEALVCRLPGWIRERAERGGVNDPQVQSLIIEHVAQGWIE